MTALYNPRDAADVRKLIADYPLAWLVSRDFHASPLPLIAETDADGAVTSLFGHCARRNPLVGDFRSDPRGLILFTGPHAYVPPSLLSKPAWAPTWKDRKSVGLGKSVSVRVDLGGRRIIKKKKK